MTEQQQVWVAEHPVIRISNELDWPPFDFVEEGKPAGFNIDYLEMLSQKLGLQIEWVNGHTWPELVEMTKNKQIDVLQGTAAIESRSSFLNYTPTFVANPTALFVRPDEKATAIQGLDTLDGKIIAIPKGYYSNTYVREHYPHYHVLDVPDPLAGLTAVSRGEADVYIDWLPVGNYLIKNMQIPNVVFGAFAGKLDLEESGLHLGVRKDWPELTSILETGIAMVSAEEYEQLSRKWTMLPPAEDSLEGVVLTDRERAWLDQHPLIRLGVDPDHPPFDIVTGDGRFAGIASDYIDLVSQKLGIRTQMVSGLSMNEMIEAVRSSKVDVLPAISATDKHSAFLLFTQPYAEFQSVVLTRTDMPFIEGLDDSLIKRVAVAKGYAVNERLEELYPDLNRSLFDTPFEALREVSLGRADAAVMNLAVATYLIRANSITNLKVAAPADLALPGLSFGVRKDWPELVGILNKYLAAISAETHNRIRDKWLSVDYEYGLNPVKIFTWVAGVLVILGLIFSVIIYWNRRLKNEVSMRTRAEKTLRESEDTYQQFFESTFDGIILHDNGLSVEMNPTFLRIFGYEQDDKKDLIGISVLNFLDESSHASIIQAMADDAIRPYYNLAQNETHLGKRKDGSTFPILIMGRPFTYKGRELRMASVMDITERKRSELALASAKEEAEQANRAKSEFLSRMSHDVRTPMNAVLGALQLLNDTALNEAQRKAIRVANSSGETLLSLVDDVLDFAKIESGIIDLHIEPFDIRTLVEEIKAAFAHQATLKGLTLEISVESTIPHLLEGDRRRVRQVLTNLVGNAFKFTREGGVEIRCEAEAAEAKEKDAAPNRTWILTLSVCDTGIGIKPENLATIFEAFKQPSNPTSDPAEGFGLGLAICRSLVKVMGGDICVKSTPGKGSCFYFQLPLIESTTPRAADQSDNTTSHKALSLLLVEDDEANRYIGEGLIQALGHKVHTAADGKAAVHLADTGCFDAILMDIRMPGMSGLDATRAIRALPSDARKVPIIALTANASTADIQATREAGMNAFLTKPLRKADLATTLHKVLEEISHRQHGDIPLIDESVIAELRRNLSAERFQTSRDICLKSIETCLVLLEDATANRSFDQLSHAGHRLKGVGAMFGLPRMQWLAERIETEAQVKNSEVFEQLWPLLKRCSEETLESLRALP